MHFASPCDAPANQACFALPAFPSWNASPLAGILQLLQDTREFTLSDAGLARFDSQRLEQLQQLASQESGICLDRVEVLSALLEETLGSTEPADTCLLLQTVQQLRRGIADYRRWLTFADNASYYRDSPQARSRIASTLSS